MKYRVRLFEKISEPAHPDEIAYSALARDMARFFFEFLRNLLVIGGIKYLSVKTGSAYLNILFLASIVMMGMFISSYLASWDVKVFRHIGEAWPYEAADFVAGLLVMTVLWFGGYALVVSTVSEIAAAQMH